MADLERERATFEEHIDQWRVNHLGECVLIKGDEVIGFYPTIEKAFEDGTSKFGADLFFVRMIVPEDQVNVSFAGARLLAK